MKLYRLWIKIKHRNFLEIWSMIYRAKHANPAYTNQWALEQINSDIAELEQRWNGTDKL